MIDSSGINQAWSEHHGFLLDVAYRLLGSYSDAEDIVQEAFTRLLRSDLEGAFGADKANAFWSLFTSRRDGGGDFTYPTELSPVVHRPLVGIGDPLLFSV